MALIPLAEASHSYATFQLCCAFHNQPRMPVLNRMSIISSKSRRRAAAYYSGNHSLKANLP